MIGLVLMLHFGVFHLLALGLQKAGFHAVPNMRSPLLSDSLADFWGRRWNTAFSTLANTYGFRPLGRLLGPRAAAIVVFLVSGLLHEVVITVPAGGGFGLPTLYFALQGLGLLAERHPFLRRHRLLRRLFAGMLLVGPVGCLFPPRFVHEVILPMLHALGAS